MRFRRHATRVVLWGGRPTLDRQFGSPLDLRLSRIDTIAWLKMRDLERAIRAAQRAALVSFTQVHENLTAAAAAFDRASLTLKRAKDMTR